KSIAAENEDLSVRGRLQPTRAVEGQPARKLPPRGSAFHLMDPTRTEPNESTLGCSELHLQVEGWQCGTLCNNARFLEISEAGPCPEKGQVLLTVPYAGGVYSGGHSKVEVRARVKVEPQNSPVVVESVVWGFRLVEE